MSYSKPHRFQQTLMQQFLEDPRTQNLAQVHNSSIHLAMVVKRGKVLSAASNRVGSRVRGCGWSDYTIHAEKHAIKQLGDYNHLRGADLYVMRISRNMMATGSERFQSSEPCHDCQLFLQKCMKQYGLKNVYYTAQLEPLDRQFELEPLYQLLKFASLNPFATSYSFFRSLFERVSQAA